MAVPLMNDEFLVLLDDTSPGDVLPEQARVTHRASDRVLTVLLGEDDVRQLSADARIAYVGVGRPGSALLDRLDDRETLFVEGWLVRIAGKPERPGEGLPWDAEGMTPPDLPRDDGR